MANTLKSKEAKLIDSPVYCPTPSWSDKVCQPGSSLVVLGIGEGELDSFCFFEIRPCFVVQARAEFTAVLP